MEACQPATPSVAKLLDRHDDADGLPHAVPVWGVWVDGALYFGTDRRSRKARNLATNQGAVVHLESGDDAVILEGFAEEITSS